MRLNWASVRLVRLQQNGMRQAGPESANRGQARRSTVDSTRVVQPVIRIRQGRTTSGVSTKARLKKAVRVETVTRAVTAVRVEATVRVKTAIRPETMIRVEATIRGSERECATLEWQ